MSDLSEMHEKINRVDKGVTEIKTTLKLTLPKLATKDQVRIIVSDHKEDCREERKESSDKLKRPSLPPRNGKHTAKLVTAITATAAGLTGIVELFRHFAF